MGDISENAGKTDQYNAHLAKMAADRSKELAGLKSSNAAKANKLKPATRHNYDSLRGPATRPEIDTSNLQGQMIKNIANQAKTAKGTYLLEFAP